MLLAPRCRKKSGRIVVLENNAAPSGQPTASVRQAAKLNRLSARDIVSEEFKGTVTGALVGQRRWSFLRELAQKRFVVFADAGEDDNDFFGAAQFELLSHLVRLLWESALFDNHAADVSRRQRVLETFFAVGKALQNLISIGKGVYG